MNERAPSPVSAPSADRATSGPVADGRAKNGVPAGEYGLCSHCGLPAPKGERFCCYGCDLASRIQAEGADDHAWLGGRLVVGLLLGMMVMMVSLFLYAEDIYGAGEEAGLVWMRDAYRWVGLALTTFVVLLLGLPLAARAWEQLRRGRLTMDAMIATAAGAAYALSVRAVLRGQSDVYFDSTTSAVLLATLGRYLEGTARARASRMLGPILPAAREAEVTARDPGGGPERLVRPAEIGPGMRLSIPIERVVPVDVEVLDESVDVDLAVVTGESRPVRRAPGETVPAGAVVLSDRLLGRALRSARDSTLEQLAALAKELGSRRSEWLRLADRFARALTPVIWCVAAGTFFYWTRRAGIEAGVISSLAVVLAACPCTYGVAAPLVLWLSLREALARGVLIRSPHALERLARVELVAFDKTGTLTEPAVGIHRLQREEGVKIEDVWALVGAREAKSRHPVAKAFARAASGVVPATVFDREFRTGAGVKAKDEEGRELVLGSATFLAAHGVDTGGRLGLARDGRLLATFELSETLRDDARRVIRTLKRDGVDVLLLTGDTVERAALAARALDVPAKAQLSAEGKVETIRHWGERAAMVGDGLNDAPALAGVGPSFAVEGSTDLARGVAQVTLLRPDLNLVPWTLRAARRATRTIRNLLAASTLYNVVFVGLAAAGLLRPVFAGISMLISSLLTLGVAATSTERAG